MRKSKKKPEKLTDMVDFGTAKANSARIQSTITGQKQSVISLIIIIINTSNYNKKPSWES